MNEAFGNAVAGALKLGIFLFFGSIVLWPLGIWKLVEIIIWFFGE